MDNLINSLAGETGLSGEKVSQGLGAILAFIKEKLGDDFSQIAAALPGSGDAMKAFESAKGGGGLMGAVTGALSKALGGGDALGSLGKLNFDPGEIAKFLPALLAMLQKQLPADLWAKIQDLLPKPPAA